VTPYINRMILADHAAPVRRLHSEEHQRLIVAMHDRRALLRRRLVILAVQLAVAAVAVAIIHLVIA